HRGGVLRGERAVGGRGRVGGDIRGRQGKRQQRLRTDAERLEAVGAPLLAGDAVRGGAVTSPGGLPGSLDRITLTGIEATGYHGVFEHERREGQPFIADVELGLDLRPASV